MNKAQKVANFRLAALAYTTCWSMILSGCDGESLSSDNEASTGTESVIELMAMGIDKPVPYSDGFSDERITESSGLQRSGQVDNVFYVHNDSGSTAQLYVTDSIGQALGTISLTDTVAFDWEAIAGVELDGRDYLVVGDIGDNDRVRRNLQVHVLAEPMFENLASGFTVQALNRTLKLTYADGASYDAEAMLIDSTDNTVVIVTKNRQDTSSQGIWTGSLSEGLSTGNLIVEYRGLVDLPSEALVNAVTDMDIHPDNCEIALLTYGALSTGQVYIWVPREGEGLVDALSRGRDRVVSVPFAGDNIQAEGISYSANGEHLLVSAEGRPQSVLSVISAK